MKLPKIDIVSYSGDRLKWNEFWDSFECTVHKNSRLSNIEKFSYLISKLSGEAACVISGLALSNENYDIAIACLKERFGNKQEVVDLHYSQIINLQAATNNTQSLRLFLDRIQRHLRSLEVLKRVVLKYETGNLGEMGRNVQFVGEMGMFCLETDTKTKFKLCVRFNSYTRYFR